uniref:G_PROTEIN_RECEP_F1_2 domain-containing protein n=1 Tax=Rhabditophanes sp. KR3021 TaxID=114890 RepID=A0AC35U8E6_9BILA
METTALFDYYKTYIYYLKLLLSINDKIVFVIGFSVSILLMYICQTIKMEEFKKYKKIIFLFAVTDIFYNTAQVLNQHAYEQANRYAFFIIHGPALYFNKNIMLISVLSEIEFAMVELANNLVAFFYRYLLIVNHCLTTYQFLFLILLNILWNSILCIFMFTEAKRISNAEIVTNKQLLLPEFFIGTNQESLNYFVLINPNSIFSYLGLLVLGCTTTIIFIGISITFVKIQKKLKENMNMTSEKTKKLQNQLTLVMVVHVITPLLLMGLPVTFILASLALNIDTNSYGYGHILFMIMVWPNVVNPLCSIFLIGPCYKKFCLIFHIRSSKQTPTTKLTQTKMG